MRHKLIICSAIDRSLKAASFRERHTLPMENQMSEIDAAMSAARVDLESALEQFSQVPPDRRGDVLNRALEHGFKCSKRGVWHAPDGMTLASWLTFVLPREAAHLLSLPQATTTAAPATLPSGYRAQLMHRLNLANGCASNYGL